jgi:hypothetical protein
MADFKKEEYKVYLKLCEELKLVHEYRTGDWFYEHTPPMVVSESGVAYVKCWNIEWSYIEKDLGQWWFWLPNMSDWLEMLEKEGYDDLELIHWTEKKRLENVRYMMRPSESDGRGPVVGGQTREEAAARLWQAVTSGKKGAGGRKSGAKLTPAQVKARKGKIGERKR